MSNLQPMAHTYPWIGLNVVQQVHRWQDYVSVKRVGHFSLENIRDVYRYVPFLPHTVHCL